MLCCLPKTQQDRREMKMGLRPKDFLYVLYLNIAISIFTDCTVWDLSYWCIITPTVALVVFINQDR
jgi:hypothetical protein